MGGKKTAVARDRQKTTVQPPFTAGEEIRAKTTKDCKSNYLITSIIVSRANKNNNEGVDE